MQHSQHAQWMRYAVQVVYQWACGTAFTDICQLTDVMEARPFEKALNNDLHHLAKRLLAPGPTYELICHDTPAMQTETLNPDCSCMSSQGSIVRAVVRLDETCREFRDAARVMGDTALWAQMTAASAAIKRDVVFAASLYVA